MIALLTALGTTLGAALILGARTPLQAARATRTERD